MPMSVGTVGGLTRTHPSASASLKMLSVSEAPELARIVAAVGLVQNLAALRALVAEGIVHGHMQLHAANLALSTDATQAERPHLVAKLRERLNDKRRISLQDAWEILAAIRT